MAAKPFRITKQCLADIDGIADFLVTRNRRAAKRVVATLLETLEQIARRPRMGEQRDDLAAGIRTLSPKRPAHNYVICYYERSDTVEISRVFHGAQDWPNQLARNSD
jgi:plasmid stabilization system protein ParE